MEKVSGGMRCVSTRGQSPAVIFPKAVLDGIAPDGGLYIPEHIPRLGLAAMLSLSSYEAMADIIFAALLPGYTEKTLMSSARSAYGKDLFPQEVTPLVSVGDHQVLELFHGPTAAFKDLALSVLPSLLSASRQLLMPKSHFLILTATSGDTGSAAMHGFSGVPGFSALVFYPFRGISAVQKAQMTSMPGSNVDAVGILGNFDDAQTGVKRVFQSFQKRDVAVLETFRLSSANSINIGRLIPQIVYYFKAYRDLVARGVIQSGDRVDFAVPTGNFGDILAGYFARELGLPVGLLICASNQNSVLTDFLQTGVYDFNRELLPSLSPSMDILVSSNLERLLYSASGGDAEKVSMLMRNAQENKRYAADDSMMKKIREVFLGVSCSDKQALETISHVFKEQGYLLDPHTAAAWYALEEVKKKGLANPVGVVLSTASPFKFPGAMLLALDKRKTEDSLDLLRQLEDLTGQKAPSALLNLLFMETLHDEVIPLQEMEAYVMRRAAKW